MVTLRAVYDFIDEGQLSGEDPLQAASHPHRDEED